MITLNCPVCDAQVELSKHAKLNDRVTCSNCYAQLAFKKIKGKLKLRCSLCLDDHAVCNEDCERRMTHLKQMDLLE